MEYKDGPFVGARPLPPCICDFPPTASCCTFRCTPTPAPKCGCCRSRPEAAKPRRIFEKVPWNRPVAASWMPDSRASGAGRQPGSGHRRHALAGRHALPKSLTRLLADPDSGQTTPSVSPDGKRLLFSKVGSGSGHRRAAAGRLRAAHAAGHQPAGVRAHLVAFGRSVRLRHAAQRHGRAVGAQHAGKLGTGRW